MMFSSTTPRLGSATICGYQHTISFLVPNINQSEPTSGPSELRYHRELGELPTISNNKLRLFERRITILGCLNRDHDASRFLVMLIADSADNLMDGGDLLNWTGPGHCSDLPSAQTTSNTVLGELELSHEATASLSSSSLPRCHPQTIAIPIR